MINDRTLPSFLALLALSLAAVAAYLPETSTRTMAASPLQPGEVAVVRETETATIYVGGETGSAVRVSEPTAIRGWRIEDIPADELAIITSGVTIENGAYYVRGSAATGIVSVIAKGGEKIAEYDFLEGHGDAGISPDVGGVYVKASGPELTFTINPQAYGWICVSNIVCRRVAFGDGTPVNDLRTTFYDFVDELGPWSLGNLRDWIKHLYDGNRGKDWADYKAKNKVRLDSHAISFDEADRYTMRRDGATNLVLQAGGRAAMTVSFRGANVSSRGFYITDYSISSGTAYITFFADIDGFDPSNIAVKYKEKLTDETWTTLTSGEFSVYGNTIAIPGQVVGSGFYRLSYGAAVVEALEIRFAGLVIVEDKLIIRGSGSSTNKYYQITVDGGTISATEVPL